MHSAGPSETYPPLTTEPLPGRARLHLVMSHARREVVPAHEALEQGLARKASIGAHHQAGWPQRRSNEGRLSARPAHVAGEAPDSAAVGLIGQVPR